MDDHKKPELNRALIALSQLLLLFYQALPTPLCSSTEMKLCCLRF